MPQTKTALPTDIPVLTHIADAMKEIALERAANGEPAERVKPVRHIFERGARIYLWFLPAGTAMHVGGKPLVIESDQWKLAVARDGVFPGDVEMKTFRRAFGITGIFFNDGPQVWRTIPQNETTLRYAYILRWFVRTEQSEI